MGWSRICMLALKKCRIGEVQDSRWLRETKKECAGKDVFLLEIAKGRALDGSAALFKKFCKRDFCDEVRDFKIPEPEAVAS